MLNTTSNNAAIHHIANNMYSNNSNITNSFPPAINNSLFLPFYDLNDVVFNLGVGKFPPAVKDDSGVTFNNSLVIPPPSRKRHREPPVLSPAMISGIGLPSLLTSSTSSIVNKESNGFSFLGENFSLQMMQQQLELDRLISQHMEKMRMEIEERKKQQLRRVIAAVEDAMSKKMREKDEEIEKMLKINWELQEKIKTICLQNQIWRDMAQTNEATANALRIHLEQVMQQNDVVRTAGELSDDAVSCCGSSGEVEGEENQWRKRRTCNDGESRWVYRGKKENGETRNGDEKGKSENRMCKKCGEGESRVLLLPCKHLCLCTSCGPTVNACPICRVLIPYLWHLLHLLPL